MSLSLSNLLSSKPFVILDGAMGTELERNGYETTLPLWSAMANVENPLLVKQIHDTYIAAGADIITTNTFRTTRHTFSKIHKPELAPHVTRLAVELAQEAISEFYSSSPTVRGRRILLAGSVAPLEDCYSPHLVPSEEIIRGVYTEHLDVLMHAKVDFILAETMINRAEVHFIANYLHEKGFPFMMSFTTRDGALLDGTPLDKLIPEIIEYNPLALMLNCRGSVEITRTLPILQNLFHGMTGAYANGPGHPDEIVGWKIIEGSVQEYLDAAKQWIQRGALIVGGCCGTTPEHIRSLFDYRASLTTLAK